MHALIVGMALVISIAAAKTAPEEPIVAPAASAPSGAAPGTPSQRPTPDDGPAYRISRFRIKFLRDNPGLPSADSLMNLRVPLGWTYEGYIAPRWPGSGIPTVQVALRDADHRPAESYYASALQRILERVRDELTERHHLMAVYVAPDPQQISDTGQDYRDPDDHTLTILIATGVVTEMRTLASGDRVGDGREIEPEQRINHPRHWRILARSPIQPQPVDEPRPEALLRRDLLDRYVFHLGRHPGRRVDASIAPGLEPGTIALDYQITENPPFTMYAQLSNTGTRSTDRWRQRFGFVHTQLTANDDILSFDFVTAWLDDANAVMASYEAPFENDRIRWRVHGNWSEFTADQVGFFDDDFEGESWALGGEVIANVFQKRELFIDVFAGGRFERIRVDNGAFGITGDESFFVPTVGARMEQATEWFATQAEVALDWWLSGADSDELAALGRTAPDENAPVLRWAASHAVYLEPLLHPEAWLDPTSPQSSTLAHEMVLAMRGQFAFDHRLIPQAEQVVGGLYTVRGYPESATAGDSVIIGTLEYRYHVPRVFPIEREPRELFGRAFRAAPQYVYGRPDWDLLLKAFFDAGRTFNSDRLGFEDDETLMGAGVGVELQYRRNVTLRLDWGFALQDVDSADVDAGDSRLHFVATLLF